MNFRVRSEHLWPAPPQKKKNGNRVFYVGYFIMSCTGFAFTVLTRCSYGFPLRLWFLVQFSLLQAIFPTAAHEKSYVQNGFEWRVWSPLSQRKCLFISVCVLEISFISVFFTIPNQNYNNNLRLRANVAYERCFFKPYSHWKRRLETN